MHVLAPQTCWYSKRFTGQIRFTSMCQLWQITKFNTSLFNTCMSVVVNYSFIWLIFSTLFFKRWDTYATLIKAVGLQLKKNKFSQYNSIRYAFCHQTIKCFLLGFKRVERMKFCRNLSSLGMTIAINRHTRMNSQRNSQRKHYFIVYI